MIYWRLFWVFFEIGLFGFGGGYAMLSLIQEEVVTQNHWLTMGEFTDIVAISQITPGPIGINSATYVGYKVTHSVWGSIVATAAVSLPSFILVFILSILFSKAQENRWIKAAFSGLRPATVGLIASAALFLLFHPNALRALKFGEVIVQENFIDWRSFLIFFGVLFIGIKQWIHPVLLLLLAGVVGLFLYS